MEWLWTAVGMLVAGVVTYLVAKLGLSGKIGDLTGKIDAFKLAFAEFVSVLTSSFKPDDDGTVRLTTEEVLSIKVALQKILDLFGVTIPLKF